MSKLFRTDGMTPVSKYRDRDFGQKLAHGLKRREVLAGPRPNDTAGGDKFNGGDLHVPDHIHAARVEAGDNSAQVDRPRDQDPAATVYLAGKSPERSNLLFWLQWHPKDLGFDRPIRPRLAGLEKGLAVLLHRVDRAFSHEEVNPGDPMADEAVDGVSDGPVIVHRNERQLYGWSGITQQQAGAPERANIRWCKLDTESNTKSFSDCSTSGRRRIWARAVSRALEDCSIRH